MSQNQFNVSLFNYPYKSGDVFELTPVGDIHLDTDLCSKEHWDRFKKEEKEKIASGKKKFYLGMGDYTDFMSDSERYAVLVSKFHDTSKKSFDHFIKDKIDRLVDDLSFMSGRLLGLHEGNHYHLFASGITSTQYMCEKLGCKYLGGTALHRISFSNFDRSMLSVDIFSAHHGTGGRLLGSSINSLQKMSDVCSADIQGHNHQRSAIVVAKPLFLNARGVVKSRKMVLCNSGTFLRGYVAKLGEPGQESYCVKTWMRPTELGVCHIELIPTRTSSKDHSDRYVDFRVIQ